MSNTLRVKILAGGDIKLDARNVYGSESEILDILKGIARKAGGDDSTLKVEGHHHDHVGEHHHDHGHHHHHG